MYVDWKKLPEWHVETRKASRVHPLFGMELILPPNTNFSVPPLSTSGTQVDRIKQDDRVYNPIINNDKRDVAKLYRSLNIERELFPYTRSCEDDKHIDGHCGVCWWCKERIWGFGYLE